MGNTVLGLAIMLVSTSMMNVGAVLQKKAVDRLPPLDERPLRSSMRAVLGTPLWLFGWAMTTTAMVLNMVALGLADLSIVQPVNGFGLVVLALFSRWYLGERLTPVTLTGIAAVMAGVVVIGATAPPSHAFTGVDEILGCYTHGSALLALLLAPAIIFVLWALARRTARHGGILFALVAACSSVTGLTFSKGLFGMLAVAGAGAVLGSWPSYLLLLLLLCFSTLAIMLQQLSFQKGRAVVVTPVFAAASVALPLAMGALVFRERVGWSMLVALACIVTGVVLLGARQGEGDESARPVAEGS